jgi:hypothetical protein
MRTFGPFSSGEGSGGAGAAENNTSYDTTIKGRIKAVYVDYKDSPPATTDVIVKTLGVSPKAPTQTILSLADNNTSGWYYPVQQLHTTAGAAIAATYNDGIPVDDKINISIAQADDDDYVEIWLLVE